MECEYSSSWISEAVFTQPSKSSKGKNSEACINFGFASCVGCILAFLTNGRSKKMQRPPPFHSMQMIWRQQVEIMQDRSFCPCKPFLMNQFPWEGLWLGWCKWRGQMSRLWQYGRVRRHFLCPVLPLGTLSTPACSFGSPALLSSHSNSLLSFTTHTLATYIVPREKSQPRDGFRKCPFWHFP